MEARFSRQKNFYTYGVFLRKYAIGVKGPNGVDSAESDAESDVTMYAEENPVKNLRTISEPSTSCKKIINAKIRTPKRLPQNRA